MSYIRLALAILLASAFSAPAQTPEPLKGTTIAPHALKSYEPVTDAVAEHPALAAILRTSQALFDRMTPEEVRPEAWHVELHQFRIEARPGEAGRPTPEGMHRDGVDWVLVLMVRRENIASGETTIYDLVKRPLGSFTLTAPLDSALVDDSRVYHGVTAVTAIDQRLPAYRDVLVVTFRRE